MAAIDARRARAGRGADRAGRARRSRESPSTCSAARTAVASSSSRARATTATTGGRPRAAPARRGVRVRVVDAADALPRRARLRSRDRRRLRHRLPRATYDAPDPGGAPVLAVDIPCGCDGLTGEAGDERGARRRHGHLRGLEARPVLLARREPLRRGRRRRHRARRRHGRARIWSRRPTSRVAPGAGPSAQVAGRGVDRRRIAGHDRRAPPGCARAPQRAGAGYVRLSVPGVEPDPRTAGRGRAARRCRRSGWIVDVLDGSSGSRRSSSAPGLGRADADREAVRAASCRSDRPDGRRRRRARRAGRADAAAAVIASRRSRPSSRRTTASSSGSPGNRPGPTHRRRPGLAPPTGATVLLKGSDHRRGRPDGGCCSRPRATPGWPPRARATCCPASSPRSSPRASTRPRPRRVPPSCTPPRAT